MFFFAKVKPQVVNYLSLRNLSTQKEFLAPGTLTRQNTVALSGLQDIFLTLTWSVMLQMVIIESLARRKSSVTFSPRATEQRVSRLLRTTSLSALLNKKHSKGTFYHKGMKYTFYVNNYPLILQSEVTTSMAYNSETAVCSPCQCDTAAQIMRVGGWVRRST